MEIPEVFYTHQWALALSRAFSETISPLLLLVHDRNHLCGVASLATLPGRSDRAFFLAGSSADYCDVLSEPELRAEVLTVVVSEIWRLGICRIELANIPTDSATSQQLRTIAGRHGYYFHQRLAYECPQIRLGGEQQRQQLLEAVRKRKDKKRDLRIEKLGPVRLAQVPANKVQAELNSICSAQIARFLATQRISPLVRSERRSLLAELTRRLGDADWLKVSRLEIGGRPAAWHFGFCFHKSLFWYLPTFSMNYEDCSPGSHLFRLVIEDGIRNPSLERIDLGLGDEAYKGRYATDLRSTRFLRLSTSKLDHWVHLIRHRLSKNIQRSPHVDARLRQLRDLGRSLTTRIRRNGLPAQAVHIFQSIWRKVHSCDKVLLFEAPMMEQKPSEEASLSALDWQQLADAAIENADDLETLDYLKRSASRLRAGGSHGYVLRQEGRARHFLWTSHFDGFQIPDVKYRLQSSDPTAAIIFDSWTPPAERGLGGFSLAIRKAAAQLQQENKQVWIFTGATDEYSLRGILEAGFVHRFSLMRKTWLTYGDVKRIPATEVSSQNLRAD